MIEVVVLDIEGTTSATEFVTGTLFPYARARIAQHLRDRCAHPAAFPVEARVIAATRAELGDPDATIDAVIAALEGWSDTDAKIAPLKTVQGAIWSDGFATGELHGHFFPDVVPALRSWHAAGIRLAVFSSGSVEAQRDVFRTSNEGDIGSLVSANFDTENAGPKREPRSYEAIAASLGSAPAQILFLSDVSAELDAARDAGWQTVGVRRPGEPQYDAGVGDHRAIASFAELAVINPVG